MSKKYTAPFVVTTSYKKPDKAEIMELIYFKMQEFKKKFYTEPFGVVLGPNEYLAFIEVSREQNKYSYQPTYFGTEVFGLRIFVKTSKGIDLLIENRDAFIFAKGEIK